MPACQRCVVELGPVDSRFCPACIEVLWTLIETIQTRRRLVHLLARRLGDVLEDAYQTGAFL